MAYHLKEKGPIEKITGDISGKSIYILKLRKWWWPVFNA
jgi:hypothetical protein